jgi:hypothetical protein
VLLSRPYTGVIPTLLRCPSPRLLPAYSGPLEGLPVILGALHPTSREITGADLARVPPPETRRELMPLSRVYTYFKHSFGVLL